jgi:hypothetical protein
MIQTSRPDGEAESAAGVVGNERMTAQAGALLLILSALVTATAGYAHGLLPIHIFVGVLFLGPLAEMLGTTGYRFLRFYTGAAAFVRRGRPRLALRILAPLLLVSTLLVVTSGLALLWAGSGLLVLHVFTALFWLPIIALHAFAHTPSILRLIGDDWRAAIRGAMPGRALRLSVTLIALLAGVAAAVVVQPTAAPMLAWASTIAFGPGPFIVGMLVSVLAVVMVRPLRWR